jgi:hypothetical protein
LKDIELRASPNGVSSRWFLCSIRFSDQSGLIRSLRIPGARWIGKHPGEHRAKEQSGPRLQGSWSTDSHPTATQCCRSDVPRRDVGKDVYVADRRGNQLDDVLAIVRRMRWWVSAGGAALYVLLPGDEPLVLLPGFALFWFSILVDCIHAFHTGLNSPAHEPVTSRTRRRAVTGGGS